MLDLEGKGISFHYVTRQGVFHIGRSWASIHTLLSKLQKYQTYSAGDQSLSVWMQGPEICFQFRNPEPGMEELCKFSADETTRIMDFLGRAPCLN